MPSNIEQFLESIVNHADEGDVTPEMRQEMLSILSQQLDSALLASAVEALPEDKLDDYEQLIASQPTAEQLQQFLSQHIPNLQDVYRLTMIEFRRQYAPDSVAEWTMARMKTSNESLRTKPCSK